LAAGCASSKQATDSAPKPAADAAVASSASSAAVPAAADPAATDAMLSRWPRGTLTANDSPGPAYTRAGQRRGSGGVLVDHVECGSLGNRPLWFDIIQPERPNRPPVPVVVRLDFAWNNSATPTTVLTRLVERGDYVCLRVPCWNLPDQANPAATPVMFCSATPALR